MDYQAFFGQRLDALKREGNYRTFVELERPAGRFPHVIWHSPTGPRDVVTWCSNDYLGMGHHRVVKEAMVQAAEAGATGAGGTRNIGGTNHWHIKLEKTLAALHRKPA